MTRLMKFNGAILLLASLALLYVALEVELYRVSYSIHKQAKDLVRVQDDHERLRMRVDTMKAWSRLEEKIQSEHMDLTLPAEVNTVVLPEALKVARHLPIESEKPAFSLLQFVKEAHAKIIAPDGD